MRMETTATPDLEKLGALAIECFRENPWKEHWELPEMVAYFKQFQDANSEFIVISDEEKVIAFGIAITLSNYWEVETFPHRHASNCAIYIAALATHSDYRTNGLCTQIVKTFVAHAKRQQMKAVYVRTRHDNLSAIKVFKKLEFTKSGEQDAETGGEVSHRHIFMLECNQ